MRIRKVSVSALVSMAALSMSTAAMAGQFKEFKDNCGEAPYGPEVKMDPATTDAQVSELRKDIVAFIKASDQFQECVTKIMESGPNFKKEDDTREKRIAIAIRFEREAVKIIDDNQNEKERVGDDFNKLIELRKTTAPK